MPIVNVDITTGHRRYTGDSDHSSTTQVSQYPEFASPLVPTSRHRLHPSPLLSRSRASRDRTFASPREDRYQRGSEQHEQHSRRTVIPPAPEAPGTRPQEPFTPAPFDTASIGREAHHDHRNHRRRPSTVEQQSVSDTTEDMAAFSEHERGQWIRAYPNTPEYYSPQQYQGYHPHQQMPGPFANAPPAMRHSQQQVAAYQHEGYPQAFGLHSDHHMSRPASPPMNVSPHQSRQAVAPAYAAEHDDTQELLNELAQRREYDRSVAEQQKRNLWAHQTEQRKKQSILREKEAQEIAEQAKIQQAIENYEADKANQAASAQALKDAEARGKKLGWAEASKQKKAANEALASGQTIVVKVCASDKDVKEKQFLFPLPKVGTWEEVEEMLTEDPARLDMYRGSWLSYYLELGCFDIENADGKIILPECWSSIVKAGLEVKVRINLPKQSEAQPARSQYGKNRGKGGDRHVAFTRDYMQRPPIVPHRSTVHAPPKGIHKEHDGIVVKGTGFRDSIALGMMYAATPRGMRKSKF